VIQQAACAAVTSSHRCQLLNITSAKQQLEQRTWYNRLSALQYFITYTPLSPLYHPDNMPATRQQHNSLCNITAALRTWYDRLSALRHVITYALPMCQKVQPNARRYTCLVRRVECAAVCHHIHLPQVPETHPQHQPVAFVQHKQKHERTWYDRLSALRYVITYTSPLSPLYAP
jgi:hypothetical protein